MKTTDILMHAAKLNASDVHITVGRPPLFRIHGVLKPISEPGIIENFSEEEKSEIKDLAPLDTDNLARQIMKPDQFDKFMTTGEYDFSYSIPGSLRIRVNVFKQRNSTALVMRLLSTQIPSIKELGLPDVIGYLARRPHGLILVTGPTGSGKSTTLAAMIDLINRESRLHIITLEDPIEYLHKHNLCTINQREIGQDTGSFAAALRAALREDPDVILVGEMRDLETIAIAITASETGHLVLATLHTPGAAETIDRIIDVFPPNQQQQIRIQLANNLEGIVSQLLLPKAGGGGRVPALEILVSTHAIKNLIREGKTYQIFSQMQTGAKYGMQTLDMCLRDLCQKQLVSRDLALINARDTESFKRDMLSPQASYS
jgi:twitching motility protein PilT